MTSGYNSPEPKNYGEVRIMANLVTILRFPLMIILVLMLYLGGSTIIFLCVPFLIIIILMDTLDGILARKRNETSLLGSALDIAADRALELILWVVFVNLGLISIAVPIIVILRDITVDAIRAVGIGQGIPPFKQSMSGLSQFLVSSPFMRSIYGIAKGFAFNFLVLNLAFDRLNHLTAGWIHVVALGFTWLAVLICCARGIPVLIDGAISLNNSDRKKVVTTTTQNPE
jgi:CDP-diacylglycerol---glycerol-3-phosphate 3-phosphatidyltransferase